MFDESHKSIVIAGITYTKVEDGVTVKASNNSLTGDLVIPYEIATASGVLKVISVEENSFSSCIGLTSVGIPNGVDYNKKDFPEGVAITVYETDTANFSFELDNGKLGVKAANKDIEGEIVIPTYVLYEGKVLPVEYVAQWGFYNCIKVTKIVLPDTITLIRSYAFENCTELGTINISKNVSQVDSCVFGGCNSLSNIVVDSDNPIFTMQGAFFIDKTSNTLVTATNNAINEGKLVIPYGVEIIDDGAFKTRKGFTEVEIPTTVRIIRYYAFGFTDLVKVDIPFGVKEIGGGAFRECTSLVAASLPSSLKRVGGGNKVNGHDVISVFGKNYSFTGMINIPCSINEVVTGDGIGLGDEKHIVVPDSYVDNYYKKKGYTGYARTGTHDYTDQPWLVDADGKHYQICRGCGVESEHSDHTFVNDAENNNHKCSVCGETGNHDFSESEYKNDGKGKHYRICALCTSESEHEACSGGTATCQKKAVCSLCKNEYGDLAAHTWDAGTVTTPATCKDKGVKTFKCTVSGCIETKTEDIAIDASNHVNTEILNAKDATCTEKGYTGDTNCKDCDTTVVGTDIAATGHDMTRVVSAKVDATCEVDGKEAVMGCKNCDHEEGGAVIPAKGHTWDAGTVTTPATCKTKGVKTFKCTVEGCTGTKTEEIVIDANNHVNKEVVGKKDATCTEKGYTGDTHCKDCEKTISEGTDIAATGHDMTKTVSAKVPATCEKDGKEAVMGCKNCDYTEGGAVIKATGHKWDTGTVTTVATCKDKGVKTFKCTVEGCTGTKTEEIVIDANNHVNKEVVGKKDATCTEKGYTGDTYCKDCEKTISEGTEIAAIGHDMTKIVSERVAATCEKDGKEAVMGCKNCDYTEGGAVIKATDHKWDSGKVTKEATVSEEGVKTFTCTNPGCKETKTEAIAKLPEPKKNAVIEDKTGNDYKVADPAKKEVTYKAPANKKAKTVTIPANVTIDGVTYKVTKIDDNAFKGNKTVTTVKVPNTVTTIGKDAFNGCSKLKTISIPKNVTEIGKNAFKGCAKLTKVTLPSKCTKIGANAFNGCKKMKTITIKSAKLTSKSVSANAFKGLSKNVIIKVPKKQLKAYKKLLKKKGFKGKVK